MRTPRMRFNRIVAGVAAITVPAAIMATASPASAYAPVSGNAEIILETNNLTGAAANANASGWWGHEGTTHNGATVFSLNFLTGSAADQAAVLAKIGPDATTGNLHVAFVKSPTATNTKPSITAGETVGQAFPDGFLQAATFGGTENGNANANDYVDVVSTSTQWGNWVAAGSPPIAYDANLAWSGDTKPADSPGTPLVSAFPAGTNVGVVYYVSTASTANGEPIVKANSSGVAETAYMPITTVADTAAGAPPAPSGATNYASLRTSGGYIDQTAGSRTAATPVTSSVASPQNPGTAVTFSTTVTNTDASNAAVTTGSVSFYDGTSTTPLATVTPNASGVASFTTSTLNSGSHSISAVYTGPTTGAPMGTSSAAAEAYTINSSPVTTVVTVNPNTNVHVGDTVTLTANSFKTGDTTSTQLPGTVTYTANNGTNTTTLASNVATGANNAQTTTAFPSAGTWTVTATFTPTDTTNYGTSSNTSAPIAVAASSTPIASNTGTVTADIPAGTLSIQTPYTTSNPLNVGNLGLNSDPTTGYTGSAPFSGIQIADSRSGDQPWTVQAQSSALTGTTPGATSINGQNIGLTGVAAASYTVGTTTYPGTPTGGTYTTKNWFAGAAAGATANGAALEPSATGINGIGGSPKTIVNTAKGIGSWNFNGTLTVIAPADTPSGHYVGTVTLTVLAQ